MTLKPTEYQIEGRDDITIRDHGIYYDDGKPRWMAYRNVDGKERDWEGNQWGIRGKTFPTPEAALDDVLAGDGLSCWVPDDEMERWEELYAVDEDDD